MIKKKFLSWIVVIFIGALAIAAPCPAQSLFDKIVYKNVLLMAVQRHVLVNRVTEEVKYILLENGRSVLLKGPAKLQFQAMYDLQRK
jgi:hypothetical protein